MPASPDPSRPLTSLADLSLGEPLGHGTSSSVFRARRGSAEVAVKVMHARPEEPDRRALYRREAAVIGTLTHPALPRIYAVGELDGRPALVMELVEGETLQELLARGTVLPEHEVVRLGMRVAGALSAAHEAGVVHRDVKPANLVIDASGEAKLIDFGLAAQSGTLQERDATIGTVRYSPPEQTGLLQRPVDGRSDLYSLGATLFEAATGHAPFAAEDVGELARLHAVAEPPDPLALSPELSPALAAILLRLLAKDPDDRYQSAHGLLHDLELTHTGRLTPSTLGSRDTAGCLPSPTPLVGRQQELRALEAAWSEATRGRGSVVVAQGPAGIGRRRLLSELAERLDPGVLDLVIEPSPRDAPLEALGRAIEQWLARVRTLDTVTRARAERALREATHAAGPPILRLTPALAEYRGGDPERASASVEQRTRAAAQFLLRLATQHGAALVRVPEANQLDEGTAEVLGLVAAGLQEVPLLLALTDEPADSRKPAAALAAVIAGAHTISLTALPAAESAELASLLLGGAEVSSEVADQLHRRAAGNPAALREYARSITHAGSVVPEWGSLVVDGHGLAALRLPENMVELVQQRVDELPHTARVLLEAAAILGPEFALAEAQRVATLNEAEWNEATDAALASQVIEHRHHGSYGFVHEQARTALLATLPDAQRVHLHRRAADEREARAGTTPSLAAAREIAEHLAACGEFVPVRRLVSWHRTAGLRALDEMAFGLAEHHLAAARTAILASGERIDAQLHEASARALLGLGEMPAAARQFDAALGVSESPQQRAGMLLTRSQMRFSAYDAIGAYDAATEGLRELGWRRPRVRLLFGLTVLASAITGLVMIGRRRVGTLPAEQRAHAALLINLLRAAGQARYLLLQPISAAAYTLLSLPWAARLGPSRELAQAMSTGAVVAASFGARGLRGRLIDGARRVGTHIGDPAATAYAEMHEVLSLEAAGEDRAAGEAARGVLREHGAWLETSDLMLLAGAIAWNLDLRGHTREALQQWQLVYDRSRLASEAGAAENPYLLMGWITLENLGMRAEAAALRSEVQALGEAGAANRYRRQAYLGALVRYLRDQGEYGAEMTEALDGLSALALNPATINPWAQPAFTQPYEVEVERACRAGSPEERAQHLASARARRRPLRRMRLLPMLRATALIADARVARLTGKPRRAARHLAHAERLAVAHDIPRAHADIAEVRAQLAADRGDRAEVRRQAHLAMRTALEHGWRARQEQLHRQFGVDAGAAPASGSGAGATPVLAGRDLSTGAASQTVVPGGSLRGRRTLEALLALSLEAAHTADPEELARLSLDHVTRLLGAERALLFLADDDTAELTLQVARDHEGNDIPRAEARYSQSVVERAGRTRAAVLVTADDESVAAEAESAERYGLRSILACPLMIESRLLGVMVVDSRLARGIFGDGDGEILSAIGGHIAIALETARAAALERVVAAEREQRGLAEALRDAMAEISSTLDPTEVFARTLARAWPLIHFDRAVVLLRTPAGAWELGAVAGDLTAGPVRAALANGAGLAFLGELTSASQPRVLSRVPLGGAPLDAVIGLCGSWLSVPLVARGELVGLVLMATVEPGQLSDAHLELAGTFAAQAVVAHENARLFQTVEAMATTDELTQVHNRRHFFALADTQFATARRYGLPLAALMLDIDHFKAINDRHGHAAGDDVIREVAARLGEGIREVDLLGRYGGEEFALVLPCTGEDAAILAERLRVAIATTAVGTAAGPLSVTVSVGVAVADERDADLGATLARADAALYAAKRAGRNCIRLAEGPDAAALAA